MKIINKTKNTTVAEEAFLANTFSSRVKGLLGRKDFRPPEALIIQPCNSIHTFFMRFTIDVLFVDKNNKVIKSIPHLKPFRFTLIYFKASSAIELPAGTIETTSTQQDDILSFSSPPN